MRAAFVLSATLALVGCGALLSVSGDDDEPGPPTNAGSDASDETANGGSVVDGAPDDDAAFDAGVDAEGDAGPWLRVFVTSSTHAGDKLGSPDAVCMAAKGSLSGTWRAWISHPFRQAVNVVTGDGPWRLLDGTLVATNRAQLSTGLLAHAIDVDETGNPATADDYVWTGTSASGTTLFHCNQWTQADGGLKGTFGLKSQSGQTWTDFGEVSCLSTLRIYCFEVPE